MARTKSISQSYQEPNTIKRISSIRIPERNHRVLKLYAMQQIAANQKPDNIQTIVAHLIDQECARLLTEGIVVLPDTE